MTAIMIRPAQPADLDIIRAFILALADYERLVHEVKADRETLDRHLFGPRPMAEVLIAEHGDKAVGFALFFHNSRRSRGGRASIWRTCSSRRKRAGWAPARRCLHAWRN